MPIAHNSGGPKLDILASDSADSECVGYLCESDGEFAHAIAQVLGMDQNARMVIAAAARRWEPQSSSCIDVQF